MAKTTREWEKENNIIKTTMRIDKDLHQQVKIYSAERGQTIQETITKALEDLLKN